MAEGVGFEPTVGKMPTPDFESGAFNHSATLPSLQKSIHMILKIATLFLLASKVSQKRDREWGSRR